MSRAPMTIGMVGLGRMGSNMTMRLLQRGHHVVVYDRNVDAVAAAVTEGARGTDSLEELGRALEQPRTVWLMVPSGAATNETIEVLAGILSEGDTIVDGGNSHYRDAQRWSEALRARGIEVIDAGVSGGVWGRDLGYCLMVGGSRDAVRRVEPIFFALAPDDGFAHVGPSGAGHYAKMIHNGIEYGLLQAYAEGFALLDAAPELVTDAHQLAALWNHGSVVRSWLLELAEVALRDPAQFGRVRGYLEDSGEGRWTVEESTARAVSTPVIAASLYARFSSRAPDSYAARMIAALRNEFGGHQIFEVVDDGSPEATRAGDATSVGVP